MKRGVATELLGFALLLAATLLGSVALFAFALGLLVVVAGALMGAIVWAYTPDLPADTLSARYAGEGASEFTWSALIAELADPAVDLSHL